MSEPANDRWNSGGVYESYMGRWSRLVAKTFVSWLEPDAGQVWLDVGCGTGALTSTVLELAEPALIVGVDASSSFIDAARSRIVDRRARFEVGDAGAIPLEDQAVDFAVSGLCLNFVPEPEKALAEMARVTRAGGVVAVYLWDYAGEMQMLRTFWDTAIRLDPAAAMLDEGVRFPICAPEPMRLLFEDAGMKSVVVEGIQIETVYADFADYWSPFEGGTGPAPAYVQRLPDQQRAALEAELRRTLPVEGDGSIHLTARAWAVRGTR